VPTVTGVSARWRHPTRGGVALARTGAPQRIVWRRHGHGAGTAACARGLRGSEGGVEARVEVREGAQDA
jgi:hypothetical protein